ncbi:organic hydroperoxide resistance protein [Microbacterium stercoris]|uniref:Organic hydroperoxide resistance protein n=1 Tax=Microbacterium stercoris TaxID=2820289 RepID=A0A939TTB5_9MICO|nr:organic hydroperoxide resistance protein [Microbacterium stercoris]MBO3662804.1 organic hydroperoxide resistance protein [Microbacterium stercoris]
MSTPLYSTTATSTGEGRAGGRARTDDGVLDLTLAVPTSMGGPGGATNPEQLFAAGWSSCFHSALKMVAAQRKVTLTGSTVEAQVTLDKTDEGGLALAAALRVTVGGVDEETAQELTAAAHAVCPYSLATRGNVPVTLATIVA